MIYATHFSPLQTSKFESAASIGNDKSRKDPNKYDCKFSLRIRLGKAVEQLIWFQAGKLSDDELNKRIKIANEQTLGDRCIPTAPIPLPSLEAAEQLLEDLQNPTYMTRQERLKDLLPFLRTDLSFDLVTQAYRTIGQPGPVWQPGEMDDTMDKVAYFDCSHLQTRVWTERLVRPLQSVQP